MAAPQDSTFMCGATLLAMRQYFEGQLGSEKLRRYLEDPAVPRDAAISFMDPMLQCSSVVPDPGFMSMLHEVMNLDGGFVADAMVDFGKHLLPWLVERSGHDKSLLRVSSSFFGFASCLNHLLHQLFAALGSNSSALPEVQLVYGSETSFTLGLFISDAKTATRNAGTLWTYRGVLEYAASTLFGTRIECSNFTLKPLPTGRLFQSFKVQVPTSANAPQAAPPGPLPDAAPGRVMGLDPDTFYDLFPFHFALDQEFRVLQVGDALKRILPRLAQPGVFIGDVLRIRLPRVIWSAECVGALVKTSRGIKVTLSSETGLELCGGLHRVAQMRRSDGWLVEGKDAILFLGSPMISSMAEMETHKVFLSDFPSHDSAPEQILVATTKQAKAAQALREANQRNEDLKETLAEALASQEDKAGRPKLNVDSPGQSLLQLLDCLLMGDDVSTQQVLEARTALLRGGDSVWKPLDVDWQAVGTDAEVNVALARLLGTSGAMWSQDGADPSQESAQALTVANWLQSSPSAGARSSFGVRGSLSRTPSYPSLAAAGGRRHPLSVSSSQVQAPRDSSPGASATAKTTIHAWAPVKDGSESTCATLDVSKLKQLQSGGRVSPSPPAKAECGPSLPLGSASSSTPATRQSWLMAALQPFCCCPAKEPPAQLQLQGPDEGFGHPDPPQLPTCSGAPDRDPQPRSSTQDRETVTSTIVTLIGEQPLVDGKGGMRQSFDPTSPLTRPAGPRSAATRVGRRKISIDCYGSMMKVLVQPADEATAVLAKIDEWQFDSFALLEVTQGRPLSFLAFHLMSRMGLTRRLNLDESKLARFLLYCEDGYGDNPYHCKVHAADVLRSLHCSLTRGGVLDTISRNAVNTAAKAPPNRADSKAATTDDRDLPLFTCYLAAVVHDFQHKGVNNDYLIRTADNLALLYNDLSPMENHHVAAAFTLMQQEPYAFLSAMSAQTRAQLRKDVVELVLATDMKQHFALTGNFTHKLCLGHPAGDRKLARLPSDAFKGSRKAAAESAVSFAPQASEGSWDRETELLVLKMTLKAADLGHLTSDIEVHKKWVARLEEELFRQGDKERTLGQPVSPLMDRHKSGITKSQCGFFNVVAQPMYEGFTQVFPRCKALLTNLERNYHHWKEVEAAAATAAGGSG